MPLRHTKMRETSQQIAERLRQVRERLDVQEEFPAEVEAEAERAVAAQSLPEHDATDIAFVTIDPPGSKDLDQALAIEREATGYRVWYAIADLASLIVPGGPIDVEARKRGQTLYAPDMSIPLHPRVISEGAASLLPGQLRSTYVWSLQLDQDGALTSIEVRRSRVRSREQLTYAEAQQRIDDGDAHLALLREVGELRIRQEALRGGASLDLPDEEIALRHGAWQISRRSLLPVEEWNAQISLLTGMAAAQLQLKAGVGMLRTMPKPSAEDMQRFRNESAALGVPWQTDETYGAYLRRLPRDTPVALAIMNAARRLFRGAGYLVLDGATTAAASIQAAIGAPYAHATAPLRRLGDRYVLAICAALSAGESVPGWAVNGLPDVPSILQRTGALASKVERGSLAVITAAVLETREGEVFDAIVLDQREQGARVELVDPPVEATADVHADAGTRVRVRLERVHLDTSEVTFTSADPQS